MKNLEPSDESEHLLAYEHLLGAMDHTDRTPEQKKALASYYVALAAWEIHEKLFGFDERWDELSDLYKERQEACVWLGAIG